MSSVDVGSERDRVFEHWLNRCRDSLERYFRRLGCRSDEAADLTQDTLLQIWNKRDTFRGEVEPVFRAWAYRIGKTVWLHHLRPLRPKMEELPEDGIATPASDPAAHVEKDEIQNALRAAIDELPPRMQMCVLLMLQDRTEAEIAVLLQCELNTVKAHLFQARSKLGPRFRSLFGEVESDVDA